LSEDLKSITSSLHDARSVIKIVEAILTLKGRLNELEERVKALEKKSRSPLVAPSNRDGTVKGK